MKNKRENSIASGIIIAIGIPAIFWVYIDWRAALTALVVGQLFILLAKTYDEKES